MRIVFVTQKLDPAHPILAPALDLVEELARRGGEVAAIADAGTLDGRPANVTLREFGATGRGRRLARFVSAVRAELRGADALVAHQIPLYAIVAAPLARPRRVPVLLWYSHWKAHAALRAAERLSDVVLTADPRSFPLRSAKVTPIGQAVDVDLFAPVAVHGERGSLRAVALGRYSPAKGLPTVVEGVARARARGVDVSLAVHGFAAPGEQQRHREELAALARRLGVAEHVRLGDALPREELPALLRGSDVLVNNMEAGAADKVGYEAAASCLPVLASNPVYDDLERAAGIPLLFRRDDPGELAERLAAVAELSPEERGRIGEALRRRVEERHSVRSWVDGLLAAVEAARSQ